MKARTFRRFIGLLVLGLVLVALDAATDRWPLSRVHWPYIAVCLALSVSMFFVRVLAELCGDWRRPW